MYFDRCYTPDELKLRYRELSKLLHPDKGGNTAQFQDMQNEYERAEKTIGDRKGRNTLPEFFAINEVYEYFRRPVRYVGVEYNHYYKFVQDLGADILIDVQHIQLIRARYKTLQ